MKKSNFTMIELLVVIAILTILVSILLPSLAKAREYAKARTCANGLKGISLQAALYSQDYGDRIVPLSVPRKPVSKSLNRDYDFMGWHFLLFELNYIKSGKEIWGCPHARTVANMDLTSWAAAYYSSWGYNQHANSPNGRTSGITHRLSKVKSASRLYFMMDAIKSDTANVNSRTKHPYYRISAYAVGEGEGSPYARHLGNVNVLFLDGHLAAKPFNNVYASKDILESRWKYETNQDIWLPHL